VRVRGRGILGVGGALNCLAPSKGKSAGGAASKEEKEEEKRDIRIVTRR